MPRAPPFWALSGCPSSPSVPAGRTRAGSPPAPGATRFSEKPTHSGSSRPLGQTVGGLQAPGSEPPRGWSARRERLQPTPYWETSAFRLPQQWPFQVRMCAVKAFSLDKAMLFLETTATKRPSAYVLRSVSVSDKAAGKSQPTPAVRPRCRSTGGHRMCMARRTVRGEDGPSRNTDAEAPRKPRAAPASKAPSCIDPVEHPLSPGCASASTCVCHYGPHLHTRCFCTNPSFETCISSDLA